MTGEEREYANQWLKQSAEHEIVRSAGLVMKRTGKFRWTGGSGVGQIKEVELQFDNPVAALQCIQGIQVIQMENNLTAYKYGWLEAGKFFSAEKIVKFQPKNKRTLMSKNHISLEIDATGCLVRRELMMGNTFRELTCTWKMRATRSKPKI